MMGPKKSRILIVDDVPENIQVLAEALSVDHQVLVALDGPHALEIAGRPESPPDLILLDIMMPGMDGFEVCRRLKEKNTTRDVPVIFITASDGVEDEEAGLSLGAVDYVTKPFHLPIVLARIRNHLARKQAEEERLRLEQRLSLSRHSESLGVIAAGIAHDFNNLLAIIMGNLDLLSCQLPPEDQHRSMIESALGACRSATDLIRQMLYYTGKGYFRGRRLDLGRLLTDNRDLMQRMLPGAIALNFSVSPGLPGILADERQIRQLVMSLLTNAREAFGEKSGEVTVAAGVDEYDEAALDASRLAEKSAPGKFVWFEVTDTGCGMDEETQRRLFDPFFTTKFLGRGLGMSAVLGIVRSHRGAIFVNSGGGKGTTIRVLFPVLPEGGCETAAV